MLWVSLWGWILAFGLIEFLLLLFPNGRLPSKRWRPLAWLSAALTLMAAIFDFYLTRCRPRCSQVF